MGKPSKDYAVPLWEKANLTVYEAAAYSGIGADKLRELSDREDCEFVLWNGTKRLIKRKKLDEFLERAYVDTEQCIEKLDEGRLVEMRSRTLLPCQNHR